jgi:hypothetical protein
MMPVVLQLSGQEGAGLLVHTAPDSDGQSES